MKSNRLKSISPKRWLLRTLIILASTYAAIDLLRQDYFLAIVLTLSWAILIFAEKRIFNNERKKELNKFK